MFTREVRCVLENLNKFYFYANLAVIEQLQNSVIFEIFFEYGAFIINYRANKGSLFQNKV